MSTISDILEDVAPWLATALTSGPVGIAAMAVSKLSGIIGSDSTVASVTSTLSSMTLTADQKIAMQKADNDFQLQMKQMGFTHQEQLRVDDNNALAIVNTTMQGEQKIVDNWYAADWRPTWGYVSAASFCFVVVVCCILASYAIFAGKSEMFDFIPKLIEAFIPLFGISGAVLGIQAWKDGTSDNILAKQQGSK